MRYILVFCVVFLTGCTSFPMQQATSSYLQHLYRRIPYKTEGRYRVIDIFYATDRKIEGKTTLAKSFRPELGAGVSYGNVNIRIDPKLTIGKMLPHWYKKSGVIGLQKINPMDENAFIQKLSEKVKSSPHKSLLVIVFGYKDSFEYTAIKAAYFSYLLDVNTPILLFDWPGDQAVSIGGYLKAQELARDSGPYLSRVLCRIINKVNPDKFWIEASSLGSQVVCSAFENMCTRSDFADAELEIDHVVLAAPDVGEKEFDEKFRDEISSLSKKLTTYVSSDDEALLLSGFLDGEKKLGRQQVKRYKQKQLDEAKNILYVKSLAPDKIALVDVTPINDSSYKHGYYLEAPEFFDDFYLRIFEKPPHINRRLYLLKYKGDMNYWVLRRH